MSGFPGTFPGSFSNFSSHESLNNTTHTTRSFIDEIPTSQEFQFTPKSQSQSLYPNLDHLNSEKRFQLDQECERLGFSKKLSNNVLRELDERAAGKSTSNTVSKSVLNPRSSRFNSSHNLRFSKMESISSHYAASRNLIENSENTGSNRNHDEIEVDKENIPSYDPYSKRKPSTFFQSSTKRRKTELSQHDIHKNLPSSKSSKNLQNILKREGSSERSKIPRTSSPQRPRHESDLQGIASPSNNRMRTKATLSHTSVRAASSFGVNRTVSKALNTTILNTISEPHNPTTSKTLPRSSTLHNLTKPTASSMLRSESFRTFKGATNESSRIPKGLSKSKSIHNLKADSTQSSKPVWR